MGSHPPAPAKHRPGQPHNDQLPHLLSGLGDPSLRRLLPRRPPDARNVSRKLPRHPLAVHGHGSSVRQLHSKHHEAPLRPSSEYDHDRSVRNLHAAAHRPAVGSLDVHHGGRPPHGVRRRHVSLDRRAAAAAAAGVRRPGGGNGGAGGRRL